MTSPISQGWSLTLGRVGGEASSWISHRRSSFSRHLPKSQFPLPVTGMLSLSAPARNSALSLPDSWNSSRTAADQLLLQPCLDDQDLEAGAPGLVQALPLTP